MLEMQENHEKQEFQGEKAGSVSMIAHDDEMDPIEPVDVEPLEKP